MNASVYMRMMTISQWKLSLSNDLVFNNVSYTAGIIMEWPCGMTNCENKFFSMEEKYKPYASVVSLSRNSSFCWTGKLYNLSWGLNYHIPLMGCQVCSLSMVLLLKIHSHKFVETNIFPFLSFLKWWSNSVGTRTSNDFTAFRYKFLLNLWSNATYYNIRILSRTLARK